MVIIEYTPDGLAWPDDRAQAFVDEVKESLASQSNDVVTYRVATELTVLTALTAIAEGVLSNDQVMFKFQDLTFQASETGVLKVWPNGFCDIGMCNDERRLIAQANRLRAKRQARRLELERLPNELPKV